MPSDRDRPVIRRDLGGEATRSRRSPREQAGHVVEGCAGGQLGCDADEVAFQIRTAVRVAHDEHRIELVTEVDVHLLGTLDDGRAVVRLRAGRTDEQRDHNRQNQSCHFSTPP